VVLAHRVKVMLEVTTQPMMAHKRLVAVVLVLLVMLEAHLQLLARVEEMVVLVRQTVLVVQA
jgi:hypothetical protein